MREWPGGGNQCGGNDRPGLVTVSLHQVLATDRPQDTRDTEERGIQDNREVKTSHWIIH